MMQRAACSSEAYRSCDAGSDAALGLLSSEEFDQWVQPEDMIAPKP
jgi:fumarate hydratase class II